MTPEQIEELKEIRKRGMFSSQSVDAIRALLAEWEEQKRLIDEWNQPVPKSEWERMTQMMQRIAEDVLPDPVRYADLTPEVVRDGFIKAWGERGREIERLKEWSRHPIYEEGLAADLRALLAEWEERGARLAKVVEALRGPIHALTYIVPPDDATRLKWHDEAIRILDSLGKPSPYVPRSVQEPPAYNAKGERCDMNEGPCSCGGVSRRPAEGGEEGRGCPAGGRDRAAVERSGSGRLADTRVAG